MSLVWDDSADGAEWRKSVAGHGWWTVPAPDDDDRNLYSGPDKASAQSIAEWAATVGLVGRRGDTCGALGEAPSNQPALPGVTE